MLINPVNETQTLILIFELYKYITESEWLLFNAKSAIFKLYYGKNKFIF
jgi:hypothetical protein